MSHQSSAQPSFRWFQFSKLELVHDFTSFRLLFSVSFIVCREEILRGNFQFTLHSYESSHLGAVLIIVVDGLDRIKPELEVERGLNRNEATAFMWCSFQPYAMLSDFRALHQFSEILICRNPWNLIFGFSLLTIGFWRSWTPTISWKQKRISPKWKRNKDSEMDTTEIVFMSMIFFKNGQKLSKTFAN